METRTRQKYSQNTAHLSSFFRREESHTSIGALGYIGPAGPGRMKGFLTMKVDSGAKVNSLMSIISYGLDGIYNPKVVQPHQEELFRDRFRLSVRAVVEERQVKHVKARAEGIGAEIEAILPFNRDAEAIVYIGHNSRLRHHGGTTFTEHIEQRELVESIYRGTILGDRQPYSREGLKTMGYGYLPPIVFEGSCAEFSLGGNKGIAELASLMRDTYGYGLESARAIITNPNNIISIIRYDGSQKTGVAAMSLMERTPVSVDGRTLWIAELTDSAVRMDDRKKKMGFPLYHAVTTELISGLAKQTTPPDVVFSESNLAHPNVIKSCEMQGRVPVGYMHNHTEIEGKLTSFAVMQIPETVLKGSIRA